MRNLADRVANLPRARKILPVITAKIEVVIAVADVRKPRRETDYEPLFQIERAKQDLLHHFE